ncbi:MAG: SDR family oxidoreductase, partial [Nocardioides sp.]
MGRHQEPASLSYLEALFSLTGLRAVVTGGSSGIGRGIAEALAGAGAAVHIVARDQGRIDEVCASLRANGAEAAGSAVDLTDELATCGFADGEVLRGCDILVNCAGINPRPEFAQTTDAEYAEVMAVHVRAPYLLGQAAGPAMVARGFGRIINVGSQQSWMAFGRSGIYGVSKAATAGLTRSQAEAWSPYGVTVNTLIPGFVVTPLTAATVAEPGREEALAARSMTKRNGVPVD